MQLPEKSKLSLLEKSNKVQIKVFVLCYFPPPLLSSISSPRRDGWIQPVHLRVWLQAAQTATFHTERERESALPQQRHSEVLNPFHTCFQALTSFLSTCSTRLLPLSGDAAPSFSSLHALALPRFRPKWKHSFACFHGKTQQTPHLHLNIVHL